MSCELSREEIAKRREHLVKVQYEWRQIEELFKDYEAQIIICDMAERWRQSQEAGMVSVPPKWSADLARQYGSRQMAALKGDVHLVRECDKWIAFIVAQNWLELRAALSTAPAPADQVAHGDALEPHK